MTLVEVREQFVRHSGRYDLVIDDTGWVDNGADFFIQAGQNFLDRLRDTPKSNNTIFKELTSGSWYLTFSGCRAIREVWINNSEGRSELEKKDLPWLYQEFSATISTTDQGTPLYYCPARLRSTDMTDQMSLGTFFNYVLADSDDLRGILILGPPDESIVVEVQGLFYSDALTADGSESYWTINWPETLVKAALYQNDVFCKNPSGAEGWMRAINDDLLGLDKDVVAEVVSNISQIEG
ncbi:hypothetical protein KAX02_13720 [candidate division WOR-3 bacterium]|nr:hypothetical protein [candidate division WOR-3 bacterium]